MEFGFGLEEQRLRQEVREFLQREWDRGGMDFAGYTWNPGDLEGREVERRLREFAKKLAAMGWYTMHWPKEHGGQDAPFSRQVAYREEMAYQNAPLSLASSMVPAMIMHHGSEWQKKFILGKLGSGEWINLSQGFSEPNAGSDLANLQTRGVRDGDDWVISGQKIWNSFTHVVDWGHYLVRTDPNAPKHRGITYFLIDLKSPGITLRPLYDALGHRRWNEVFLDNVRVPSRNVIGEVDRGWYAAMTTLSFERSNIETPARMLHVLEDFIRYCSETRANGQPMIADPITRNLLADLRVRIMTCRLICYRVASLQNRGEVPVKEASMTKMSGDELIPRVYETIVRILGESAPLIPGNKRWAALDGFPTVRDYVSRMYTIGGGTAEIQRNIVAQRGLGLPR